jgi:hypothetical protein
MSSRTVSTIAAGVLAVQAVVLGLLFATGPAVLLPVTADFGGGIALTTVNLGAAVVVILGFSALCRGAAAIWSPPIIDWIEWSQVAGVTVFLIAQLNGVQDVAALVALYALTAGGTLFLVLQQQSTSGGRWPYSFGAAVVIVPWGIIAFYQIGAIIAGESPTPLIRVITVAMLALAALYWAVALRTGFSVRPRAVVSAVATSIFAWLVTAGMIGAAVVSAV